MAKESMMWVAWPAFLAACILELVVFAFVDPTELQWGAEVITWPRQAVYTGAFFLFWAISAAFCAMAGLLRASPAEINSCPFSPEQRPEGCPGALEAR